MRHFEIWELEQEWKKITSESLEWQKDIWGLRQKMGTLFFKIV